MSEAHPFAVAVPTLGRDAVLVETVGHVLRLSPPPCEVLVVDQTEVHEPAATSALAEWERQGRVQWIRLSERGTCHAMNVALERSSASFLLFLDDDCVPAGDILAAHESAYTAEDAAWCVTGRVLQPEGDVSRRPAAHGGGLQTDLDFSFVSLHRAWVRNAMGGNLSVRRADALRVGGFDEQFVGAAYRFETEFCRRVWEAGGRVLYEPAAEVRHLRAAEGGTRTFGSHLTTASPAHAVGDYYFALRCGTGWGRARYIGRRPWREVRTRFHATHPWWIPFKLIAELRAFFLALRLARQGPRLLGSACSVDHSPSAS